jgi:hypothetical protein
MKFFDPFSIPTYKLSDLVSANSDALASSCSVKRRKIEHRWANTAGKVGHQFRTDFRDRLIGSLDIIHFEHAPGVHIQPMEDAVTEVENQRKKYSVFAIQHESQVNSAGIEMMPTGIIAEHDTGESALNVA